MVKYFKDNIQLLHFSPSFYVFFVNDEKVITEANGNRSNHHWAMNNKQIRKRDNRKHFPGIGKDFYSTVNEHLSRSHYPL